MEHRRSSLVAADAKVKKDHQTRLIAQEKKDDHERLVQSIQHQFSGNKRRYTCPIFARDVCFWSLHFSRRTYEASGGSKVLM